MWRRTEDEIFKRALPLFVQITTGILIICAINYSVWGNGELPANILWQIVLSGAVTAVITEIVMSLPEPENKKKRFVLYTALHYVVYCIVMSVIGMLFDWVSKTVLGVLLMCLSVAAVYAFTMAVTYFTSKRDADDLTKLIRSKYRKK